MVSAEMTNAPGMSKEMLRAFSLLMRKQKSAGASPARIDSSTSGTAILKESPSRWRSSLLRGEADASTICMLGTH